MILKIYPPKWVNVREKSHPAAVLGNSVENFTTRAANLRGFEAPTPCAQVLPEFNLFVRGSV
jgi:hypothetical protein